MASRYPSTPYIDYCFRPIHIVDEDKDIIVPCGKCDGCLLHKANELSMRCGMEIEGSPATIFGSLTYNNKYLPKLKRIAVNDRNEYTWISDYPENIRFNGVRDVRREDNIVIKSSYEPIKVTNSDAVCINYASKRDIQLWLKLLRKDLDDYGIYKDSRVVKRGYFRYFIISEIGPTTLRSHYHFLLFCQSQEVASYLLAGSLFKNWQMCDESRFEPYVHLCDSGARGYVTQYLTCFSDLPSVYKENKEIRPFRLSSKSPAIGYIEQDKKEIYENISKGVIHYNRKIYRLESTSLLEYPSGFTSTLFPKCYRFNKISDTRRFLVYGCLFRAHRATGFSYNLLRQRFSKILQPQDYLAACACQRFCQEYVNSPDYYYYLLDTYYYKVAMQRLKDFYKSQEGVDFVKSPYRIFEYYPNIEVLCLDKDGLTSLRVSALKSCLTPLKYNVRELIGNSKFFVDLRRLIRIKNSNYFNEVSDIKENMIKVAKFNEAINNAPTF